MSEEESDTPSIFQWWKWVMVVFAFGGGFLGSTMDTTAGAIGSGVGVAGVSAIVIIGATAIYRNLLPRFLSPVPGFLYISICLLAAAVGGVVGIVGVGSGGFVATYLFLLLPVLIVFWIYEYTNRQNSEPIQS